LSDGAQLGGIVGVALIRRWRLREIVAQRGNRGAIAENREHRFGPLRPNARCGVQLLNVRVRELHQRAMYL
jgi:hypothetical protein